MSHRFPGNVLAATLLLMSLAGCGGSDDPPAPAPVPLQPGLPTYSIGGTVTGNTGPLTLQNSNGATLTVAAAGPFTFAAEMPGGAAYNVVVAIPPAGQNCVVTNGSGTVIAADISNIAITCTLAAWTLGGTVSGLGAGKSVVLQALTDGGSTNVTVNANGNFAFAQHYNPGTEYLVMVMTQPVNQTCALANDTGEVGTANVTNIAVTCANNSASNRNWKTATNIATDTDPTDSNGVFNPQVAHDSAGNAFAVWAADVVGGAGRMIMWSRKPVGGAWSAPAQIPNWGSLPPEPAFGEFARFPVIAVAPNGNAIAAWRLVSYQGDHVLASTYSPSTGWTSPVFVYYKHPDTPSGAMDLRIAADSAGNTLLVWAAHGMIFYNRHTPGTGWVGPTGINELSRPVSKLTGPSSAPEMAMNAAGQAVAIWRQGVDLVLNPAYDFDLKSSRYDMATDTWTDPVQVEDGPGDNFYGKSLVIDTAGTATAIWADFDGTVTAIRASRLVADTWAPPSLVASGNNALTEFVIAPHAAIDGNGNIVVVWQQGDIDNANFVATRYVPGTVWGGQQVIGHYVGSSSPIFSTEMSLAGNAAGHVVAVWTLSSCILAENVPCPVDVYANEYNPANGQWGVEEVIDKEYIDPEDAAGDALSPHVAVAPSGDAVAVWDQDNGPSDGIREAVFED